MLLVTNSINNKIIILLFVHFFILLSIDSSFAKCNFKSANYINELSIPKKIRSIKIDVHKSGQFNKNFARIVVSKSENIPPTLKKSFNAKVIINYKFGRCVYKAKIKQTGDWKDHVDFKIGGMPRRSLSLRLINGNILNAVKFKLLLPETRNNLHEILGSLLIKNVGFIVPETFQVKTNINGSEAIMLFQEDATKEMLERNRRREGPIFEGDENILWSYKNFANFSLEKLSLARLINKKWFLKGKNAELISLNSFIKIQKAFVEYSQNMKIKKQLIIFPNNLANNSFQEYFLTLLAMNGAHGLRPHNRRFFFNSLSNFFEPIYYDGDLALDKKGVEFSGHFKIDNDLLKNAFNENFFKNYVNPFINFNNSKKIMAEFQNRVLVPEHIAKNFYNKALFNVNHNMNELLSRIKSQVSKQVIFSNYTSNRKAYLKKHQLHKIDQTLISSLVSEKFNYSAKTENGYKLDLTAENVAEIISKNKFKNKRTVFLPFPSKYHDNNINQLRLPETKGGEIIFSDSMKVHINIKQKQITFLQNSESDWALVKNANLEEWKILFKGLAVEKKYNQIDYERLNKYGMTGCLNFYNVHFKSTSLIANRGFCEDTINIINSSGNIENIEILDAFSDGLDLDFSEMKIEKIEVKNAGNDCMDLSSGDYFIKHVIASNCSDKALSVGEKSNLLLNSFLVENSSIGISSKDLSTTTINFAKIKNVKFCYEAFQKKQEFGGGKINFKVIECLNKNVIDKNSSVIIGMK